MRSSKLALMIAVSLAMLSSGGLGLGQDTNPGSVDFPTSGSPEAQKHFLRGMVHLYSIDTRPVAPGSSVYDDSRESFRKAQELDPDFAMAYWGEALTYRRDRAAAREVLNRLAPTLQGRLAKAGTPREQGYLRAIDVLLGEGETRKLAYAEAMRRLAEAYPDDAEASLQHALALARTCGGTRQGKGQHLTCYTTAAAIAERVFHENPEHIGAARSLVLIYDDPIFAPLALRAAHVWARFDLAAHPPSHIFIALGLWEEVAASNLACVDKYESNEKHRSHCFEFASYARLQQGRYREARELDGGYSHWPRYIVETRQWDLAAVKLDTSDRGLPTKSNGLFAYGWSAVENGDLEAAGEALARLTARRETFHGTSAVRIQIMGKELEALLLLARGDREGSVALMREVTALEDDKRFAFGVRPPFVIKPAHELFGEILLELGRPQEAREQFDQALARTPRRALSLLGLARACANSGDQLRTQQAYGELRRIWRNADPELPELEELRKSR